MQGSVLFITIFNSEKETQYERERKNVVEIMVYVLLGIKIMVFCQGSVDRDTKNSYNIVTENEDQVYQEITRKCISHRDTVYLKITY